MESYETGIDISILLSARKQIYIFPKVSELLFLQILKVLKTLYLLHHIQLRVMWELFDPASQFFQLNH